MSSGKRLESPVVDEDVVVDASLPSKRAGVGWGLFAWILSWIGIAAVGAYHVLANDIEDPIEAIEFALEGYVGFSFQGLAQQYDIAEPGVMEILIWAFYSAHGVALNVDIDEQSVPIDILEAWTVVLETSELTYLATPAVILFFCGFLLARSTGVRSPEDGAKAGAFVALGYTTLFLLLYPLATMSDPAGTVSVGPDLFDLVLRGVGYPVLAGGIGGALAGYATGE